MLQVEAECLKTTQQRKKAIAQQKKNLKASLKNQGKSQAECHKNIHFPDSQHLCPLQVPQPLWNPMNSQNISIRFPMALQQHIIFSFKTIFYSLKKRYKNIWTKILHRSLYICAVIQSKLSQCCQFYISAVWAHFVYIAPLSFMWSPGMIQTSGVWKASTPDLPP